MSRGPSQDLAPVRCTTLELKDLADTDDFNLNGEIGTIYGFEYTDSGYYKRREINDKIVPRLEQLRNVAADIIGDHEYKINRVKNKWHLSPIIEWDVKFEFISPYTLFDPQRRFRKAFNAGPIHTSLVPSTDSRGNIEVKPFNKQFMLHRIIGASVSGLNFVPEVELAEEFTVIIKLMIHDDSLDNSEKQSKIVMNGIQINWTALKKEDQNVIIIVRKDESGMRATCSKEQIDVTLLPARFPNLRIIFIKHFDLIGLHYIETNLSDEILKTIF